MKWIVITLPIVVVATGFILASRFILYANSLPSGLPKEIRLNETLLWNVIQTWRKKSGYKEYIKNDSLCRIAEERVKYLKDKGFSGFNHEGFHKYYDNYQSLLSENMTGGINEQDALERWLSSTPHRNALERNYKYSCVAAEMDYAVQIFSNCENGCP